jgi:hypothetical protein
MKVDISIKDSDSLRDSCASRQAIADGLSRLLADTYQSLLIDGSGSLGHSLFCWLLQA